MITVVIILTLVAERFLTTKQGKKKLTGRMRQRRREAIRQMGKMAEERSCREGRMIVQGGKDGVSKK